MQIRPEIPPRVADDGLKNALVVPPKQALAANHHYQFLLTGGRRVMHAGSRWLPSSVAARFCSRADQVFGLLGESHVLRDRALAGDVKAKFRLEVHQGPASGIKTEAAQNAALVTEIEGIRTDLAKDENFEHVFELACAIEKIQSFPPEYLLSQTAHQILAKFEPLLPDNRDRLLGIIERLQETKRAYHELSMAVLLGTRDDVVREAQKLLLQASSQKGNVSQTPFVLDHPNALRVCMDSLYIPGNCSFIMSETDFMRILFSETLPWQELSDKKRTSIKHWAGGIFGVCMSLRNNKLHINLTKQNAPPESSSEISESKTKTSPLHRRMLKWMFRLLKDLIKMDELIISYHESFHGAHSVLMPDDFEVSDAGAHKTEITTAKNEILAFSTIQDVSSFAHFSDIAFDLKFLNLGYGLICEKLLDFNWGGYCSVFYKERKTYEKDNIKLAKLDGEIWDYINTVVTSGLAAQVLWPDPVGRWMLTLSGIKKWPELVFKALISGKIAKETANELLSSSTSPPEKQNRLHTQIQIKIQNKKTLTQTEMVVLLISLDRTKSGSRTSLAESGMLYEFHSAILEQLKTGKFPQRLIDRYDLMIKRMIQSVR